MVYDAANRLVAVTNDASTAAYKRYAYAVGNHRVTSEAGGTRTYYAGGGGQAAVEYVEAVSTGNLTWAKTYIYAGGSVLATITPGGASELVEYHHPDRLGTRLISNNQNVNVQEQETLPFGAALASGSSTRQFTSYDRSSATGLDYAVNRRYDSLQGRFTQVDPIGIKASSLLDPQSLNMYSYCGNDPVNRTDPDGLFWGWFKKFLKRVIVAAIFAAIGVAIVVLTKGIGFKAAMVMFAKSFAVLMGGGEFKAAVSARSTAPTFGRGPTFSQVLQTTPIGRALIGTAQPTPGWNPYARNYQQTNRPWNTKYEKLSDCAIKLLQPWFQDLDLSKIRAYRGIPIYVPDRYNKDAYTEGRWIYFREGIDQRSIRGIALIAHELVHTRQYQRYKPTWRDPRNFQDRYLMEAARVKWNGGDAGGIDNKYEAEAYDLGGKFSDDLKKKYGNSDPCP